MPAGLSTRLQAVSQRSGEFVIGRKARKLVPVVVDRVDLGIVGTLEVALELKIVRRIGEHEIDAIRRQLGHFGDAIADDDARRLRRGQRGDSKLPRGALRTPRDATQP